jgi:Phosphate transport regulator (distant homolog of PhoU)
LTAVRRTFITPFDRTDIQDLVTSMDDAIDQMNRTAKTITLFEVRSFDPQMQQMGEIILQAAELVLEAMPLLSSIGGNAGQLNVLTEKIITSRNMRTSYTSRAARRSSSPIAKEPTQRQCDELYRRGRALLIT